MGCPFFACFSASKNKKHQHLVDGTSSIDQGCDEAVPSRKEEEFRIPFNPIIVKKEKLRELLNLSEKKKVTFGLNVKTHEELPVESSDKLLKNNGDKESAENEGTAKGNKCPVFDSTTSSVVCKSQNNRYQNSAESEDELEDLDLEVSDLDDDDDNENGKAKNGPQLYMEESSESLFSLSIESRKQVCEVESGEKEVTSPMPTDKSAVEEVKPIGLNRNGQSVQSVLNPVENLAKWKEVKAKASIPLRPQEKENINLEQGFDIPISPEPSFKLTTLSSELCSNDKKLVGLETAVDTSLSSWLVGPENTPNSEASTNSVGNSAAAKERNSPRSLEDRPILGALTMEELKQHSATTSPRKCRSQSPDETPIIGTVGSYWSHTGQTIDTDSSSPSKGTPRTRSRNIQAYKEDRLKWNAVPLEARLERALDKGIVGI